MLQFLKKIELPPEENCSFDHGDVDQTTGRVYVAHTSSGTVEVVILCYLPESKSSSL